MEEVSFFSVLVIEVNCTTLLRKVNTVRSLLHLFDSVIHLRWIVPRTGVNINRIGILIALVSQMIKLIAVLHSILFQNDN